MTHTSTVIIPRTRIDEDLIFTPCDARDQAPPFPRDVVPCATAILDVTKIPLWMFGETTWSLYFSLRFFVDG